MMRYAFKIIARASGILDQSLRIGSYSIMRLAQDLHNKNNVALHLHGSSVAPVYQYLQNPITPPQLSDLDFIAFDHSDSFLDTKKTIETFFKTKMFPLINRDTHQVFAYQFKGETSSKFSITLYIQNPPSPLFDDIAHSTTLQLMPYPKLGHKYPDEGLISFCKDHRLLFTPASVRVHKHFFRTAMREAKGWNAGYNPGLDFRIYHDFLTSSFDPTLFKNEFLSMFYEHFEKNDKDAFLKMAFFALSRINRYAGFQFTEQFFDQIKDMFQGRVKVPFKNFSSFMAYSYVAPDTTSLVLFATLVESASTPLGKQDIFLDFQSALNLEFNLSFPILLDSQRPIRTEILRAWSIVPNPPAALFETVICPTLMSCSVTERTEYLLSWMSQKRIHLNIVERFFESTPPLRNLYLNYISELMASQKRPSLYLQNKYKHHSFQPTPAPPSPPPRRLPDPTAGFDPGLGTHLRSKKLLLRSDVLSFMDYAALESAGWRMHNAAVDTTLNEQGSLLYLATPEKFLEDLRDVCSAYFQEGDSSSRRKTAFFGFARLYRHSTPEAMAPIWEQVHTFLGLPDSESLGDFAKSLKQEGIEKPMPFLNQTAQALPSAVQIMDTLTTVSEAKDCTFLHQDLDSVLHKLLDNPPLELAPKIIGLLQKIRSHRLALSPSARDLAIKYLNRLHTTETPPSSMYPEWAFLIQQSPGHPGLNFTINALFRQFCIGQQPDPVMGPALIQYAITSRAPVTTSYLLRGLVALGDWSRYQEFISSVFSNPHFIYKEPLDQLLSLAKQLLVFDTTLYRNVLGHVLSRTDLTDAQRFSVLDLWLPVTSDAEHALFIDVMDRYAQKSSEIPDKFYDNIYRSLDHTLRFEEHPLLSDLVLSARMSQTNMSHHALLLTIQNINAPLPKTLSAFFTHFKKNMRTLSPTLYLPFLEQQTRLSIDPQNSDHLLRFLSEHIAQYAKHPSLENFSDCVTYCAKDTSPSIGFRATVLFQLIKSLPSTFPNDQTEALTSVFLSLPFDKLTHAQRHLYATLNPRVDIFQKLTADDVRACTSEEFTRCLTHFIHSQINETKFPEGLLHYCNIHPSGFSFFSEETLGTLLLRLNTDQNYFQTFLTRVTHKRLLSTYETFLFNFFSIHLDLLIRALDFDINNLTSTIYTKALHTLRDEHPHLMMLEIVLTKGFAQSAQQQKLLHAFFKKKMDSGHSFKTDFQAYPTLLAHAKEYQTMVSQHLKNELARNIHVQKNHIQSLFNEVNTSWQVYFKSKDKSCKLPTEKFKAIITYFKKLPIDIQSSVIDTPFTFSRGSEFIYALPFFITSIDDARYFYDTFKKSPNLILEAKPQLISFCIDNDHHAFLNFLFQEHHVSPNMSLILYLTNSPSSIFEYSKLKQAQNCIHTILQHPLFDSGPYMSTFIVHSALSGDLNTLSLLNEAPCLSSLRIHNTILDELFIQIHQLAEKKLPEKSLASLALLVSMNVLDPTGMVISNKVSAAPTSALACALALESKNDFKYDSTNQGLSTFLLNHGATLEDDDVENTLLFIYTRFKCYNPSASPIIELLYNKLSQINAPTDSLSIQKLFTDPSFASEENALTLVTELDRFFGQKIREVPNQSKIVALAIKHFPNYVSVIDFLYSQGYSFNTHNHADNIEIGLAAGKYASETLFSYLITKCNRFREFQLNLFNSKSPYNLISSNLNLAELLTILKQTDSQRLCYPHTIPTTERNIRCLRDNEMPVRSDITIKMEQLRSELNWMASKI